MNYFILMMTKERKEFEKDNLEKRKKFFNTLTFLLTKC